MMRMLEEIPAEFYQIWSDYFRIRRTMGASYFLHADYVELTLITSY